MKPKILIIFITLTTLCSSCVKKVNCEGTVYSKIGHQKVAGAGVTLSVYTSGKDAEVTHYSTTTDENGKFRFSEFLAKNRTFGYNCDTENDGWFHSTNVSREGIRQYDIHLH
jgi:hypothetical protein